VSKAPRRGPKTRHGAPGKAPSVRGKRRCRMHGGAPGTGAPKRNKNHLKHGLYTKAAEAERRRVTALVREAEGVLGEMEGE
jgi:hypothetical protein